MASRHILILQGHPDRSGTHFGHALAESYRLGALAMSHEVRTIAIAELEFPLLRSKAEWDAGLPPPGLVSAQADIVWADHLVIFFPLWLGDMPALLKGFLEQVARPGFAFGNSAQGGMGKKLLTGRSARIVVTMGMPAFVYRWYFGAHAVRLLERNILRFVGIAPVRRTVIGMVEGKSALPRQRWLGLLERLGRRSA